VEGGVDTVRVTRAPNQSSYGLGDNVENGVVAGAGEFYLIGNALANTLTGNSDANHLDGSSGADCMYGMGGNDTYEVRDAGDRVFEAVKGGQDLVDTHVSYALATGQEIEMLRAFGGHANISLIGNEFANSLLGDTGNNVLNGREGNDALTGNTCQDSILFNTMLSATTNVDTVTDFSHADDTVRLSKTVFQAFAAQTASTALASGALARYGATPEADDRILYWHGDGPDAGTTPDTVFLYYDATGGSRSDAVLFAKLTNQASVTLDASDFLVVA
jgi:Ca2+-binding RTX toxin-like protein